MDFPNPLYYSCAFILTHLHVVISVTHCYFDQDGAVSIIILIRLYTKGVVAIRGELAAGHSTFKSIALQPIPFEPLAFAIKSIRRAKTEWINKQVVPHCCTVSSRGVGSGRGSNGAVTTFKQSKRQLAFSFGFSPFSFENVIKITKVWIFKLYKNSTARRRGERRQRKRVHCFEYWSAWF